MSTATLNENWVAFEVRAATENQAETVMRHEVGPVIGLAAGVGTGQVDVIWTDRITVAGAGGTMLDLLGTLTSALTGAVVSFVDVNGIKIYNRSTTKTVTIGPDASNGWFGANAPFAAATDAIKIGPGGSFSWYHPVGLAPGAGATDEIYIANAGAVDADVDIMILGHSA